MDALRAASAPARLLLTLSETRRDCDLLVTRGGGRLRLGIVQGRAVSIAGADLAPLGDTLRALGEIDRRAPSALLRAPLPGPIGARLVALGATSAEAVRRALSLQLAGGVEAVLRGPNDALALAARPCDARACEISIDLAAAVWRALLGIAAALPAHVRAGLAGDDALALSETGRRRVQGLLRAARSGELAHDDARGPIDGALIARALAAEPPRELHALRAILRVLGAVHAPSARADSGYALLLRKRRELARNASASVLLELPGPSSALHVRRALRRLAQRLHPDRFEHGDARLHALSTEVMRALLGAASACTEPSA